MKRISILLASFIALSYGARSQEVVRLSLDDCMDYAMKHNYSVKNAKIDVSIQKAQNDQTLSASYPHINGRLELDDFLNPQQTFVDAHDFSFSSTTPAPPRGTIEPLAFALPWGTSASISGSQLIFDGAVFVAWKARNTVMEFAKLNGKLTEENVRYNVYKAYNSLVIAYRQNEIVKRSLAYARNMERDLAVTQQNGLAEKIDVERGDVQVNNLANDSVKVGNMLTVSEQMLKYLIGMDINTSIVLTDTVIETRKQNLLALLSEEKQYENVPEYNVATTQLRLNEYNVKRYQLSALPSLNAIGALGYNYGHDYFPNLFNFPNYAFNSMVGLQLNVPILNGFMRRYQLAEANLNVEKSKNNIENAKQTIDYQVATYRTSLKNAIIQVQTQHRNMDLANDVLDLAEKKYKAGVGSNLEVTQAQTDLLQAQSNYFSALLNVINAEADLKKALGLLK
jgi:outer membrane protein